MFYTAVLKAISNFTNMYRFQFAFHYLILRRNVKLSEMERGIMYEFI